MNLLHICIFFSLLTLIVSKIPGCSVYVKDSEGYEMSRWIATTNLKWTLHGAWPSSNSTYKCRPGDYDVFEYMARQGYVPLQWYDASPASNHTCCQLQRHEYVNHGCMNGFSPSEYWNLICTCFTYTSKKVWYPSKCRFNGTYNIINEALTWSQSTFGCKTYTLYAYDEIEVDIPFTLREAF